MTLTAAGGGVGIRRVITVTSPSPGKKRGGGRGGRILGEARDPILGEGALLYIAYIMLIWAAPIPADRWHCSLAIAKTLG